MGVATYIHTFTLHDRLTGMYIYTATCMDVKIKGYHDILGLAKPMDSLKSLLTNGNFNNPTVAMSTQQWTNSSQ